MDCQRAAADLWKLIDGFKVSQALHAAAVLGVADRIAEGVRGSDAIADAARADRASTYRLLRALVAQGVLREEEGRAFSLTPLGECLRSDAEVSLGPYAVLIGQPYYWQAWGHLPHAVRTGDSAFRAVHGEPSWAYRERHAEQNAIFNAAMTANSRRVNQAIVEAFDFDRYPIIADIGGGEGALLASILRAHPGVRGVLFDRPHVVASAGPVLAAAGVADRCGVAPGDFFEGVPAGCGAYVLKFILHDWNDSDAERILESCRRAMPPEAVVIVVERVLGAPNEDPAAAMSDLNMLVIQGGRERTRAEFEALFAGAGLRVVGIAATAAGVSMLVGTPA